MRVWPSEKRPVEKRQDGTSYTDLVTRALVAAATGEKQGTAAGTSVIETAASLYARCFAMASISPESERTRALRPTILANTVRKMVTRGESTYLIRVRDERVKLAPCGSWDTRGGDDPDEWQVQVDTYGLTSSSNTKLISYSEVLHFKWSYDSTLPWVGVGPDARAPVTGRLHGALESSLAGEVSGPQGSDIPVPQSLDKGGDEDDAEADPMFDLTRDIRGLRGSVALVETAFAGFGEGRAESPAKDWIVNRKGPNPPDSLIEPRQQSFERILASFGIPSPLFVRTDATSRREALREYLHSGLQPVSGDHRGRCRPKAGWTTRDNQYGSTVFKRSKWAGRGRFNHW